MTNVNTNKEFSDFLATFPRWQRYRLARKTFKFKVYRFMDVYILVSISLSLLHIWLTPGLLKTAILGNMLVSVVILLAHYGGVVGEKPWIPAAAAFEAFAIWAIYRWGISHYISLPDFWVLCVLIFICRFWKQGEEEINIKAFSALIAENSNDKFFGGRQPAPPCTIHPDDRDIVSSEDIEWWNNLSLQDCQALEQEDNIFRLAAFTKHRETDGLSAEEAGKKVRLSFPVYYGKLEDREDEKFPLGPADAKLPYVLKDRINRAVTSRFIGKNALMQASSMNALVRKLIRSGRI